MPVPVGIFIGPDRAVERMLIRSITLNPGPDAAGDAVAVAGPGRIAPKRPEQYAEASASARYRTKQTKRQRQRRLRIAGIKGVEVGEVCEIFERINQEGKKLDPIDIIVARTYRREDPAKGQPGFYLRDDLKALKEVLVSKGNQFQYLDDLTIVQMFALCLRKTHTTGRNPFGITPAALDNLTADHFQQHWPECKKTVLETIKFLCDLKIQGPAMLPFTYLALPLCQYFHCNSKPNRDVARQWFWRKSTRN